MGTSHKVTLEHTLTIVVENCCTCGTPFGMSDGFRAARLKDGALFYCPAGHPQHFSESTEAKLKRVQAELDKQKIQLSQKEADARFWRDRNAEAGAERERVERRLIATKGVVTKMRKRVGQGVCPCCNRTFSALARHMKTKHPEYHAEDLNE